MDEPDFDDLIEDYMEDAFEEPSTEAAYLDDMMFEEMEAAESGANNNAAEKQAESAIKTTGTPASPISTNFESRLAAVSPQGPATPAVTVEPSTAQVRHEFARSRSQTGTAEPDIFSFERYKPSKSWRGDAKMSPTTMRAREWKSTQQRRTTGYFPRNNNRLATTPEAQLLQYQRNRRSTPRVTLSRRDKNMSLHPMEGQKQFPMTLGDGNRVFVKTTPVEELPQQRSNSHNTNNVYSLGISMTDLIRRVQALQRKNEHDKMRQLSKQLKDQKQKAKETTEDDHDDGVDDHIEEQPGLSALTTPDDQLWVDKHAPSTFANLLSDERTNREVLRALREWDPYVFNRDPPPRPQFARQNEEEENRSKNPNDKRPDERHRVILLSGPPGVGKSTLAHIVAKHCGYRPLEVNGSDERSASVLTERVIRAMESTTLDMNAKNRKQWKGRPNCLILDEIDGADASKALQSLVELIRQEATNPSKEGKRRKPYLKRPIIFICNNLYAPALRPLLPYARRFQVGSPSSPRLVARLRAVLSSEGLSLWGGATLLNELVTATGGDIRSCLYTLQFAAAEVHQKASKDADISHALTSALNGNGMKDDRSDVAGTTMTIFRKKKKGNGDKLWGTKQLQDTRTNTERVLEAVESFGDNNKILDCLYLNILNVPYIDPTFDRCAAALEWLSGADLRGCEQFYVPCASAAIHLLCRVDQKPELTYTTRALSDAYYQTEANKGLTQKFAEGLSMRVRSSRCIDGMVTETIPYALWMLSAGEGSSALCRPASSLEILNKAEQRAFRSHMITLHTLGLTYVVATEDDQGAYSSPKNRNTQSIRMVLEPPIDRLLQFHQLNVRPSDQRKEIPPAMKELLARGSVLEGIRESRATKRPVHEAPQGSQQQATRPSSTKEHSAQAVTSIKENSVVNPLVTPHAAADGKNKHNEAGPTGDPPDQDRPKKKSKIAIPITQNFLGLGAKRAKEARAKKRARNVGFIQSKESKKSNTGSGVPFQQVLRLKYVKGFTQAVRNPCRLEDLA